MSERWTIAVGDATECLRLMPEASVQCCVTSPPYWGLRDYGVDGQIGMEETPEMFVAAMVSVFREVRRVLRDDGTLWVNLGDSYCSTDKWGGGGHNTGKQTVDSAGSVPSWAVRRKRAPIDGIKPKDLVGIPWMVAFALRADGWFLRSDIIWSKPNPMPESITDRPGKAHEYLFLLAKSPRYFYDADAIREPHRDKAGPPTRFGEAGQSNEALKRDGAGHARSRMVSKTAPSEGYNPLGRNARTVWEIPSQPFPEAHFATFPEDLAKRCILAGTSHRGACAACGACWVRVVERTAMKTRPGAKAAALAAAHPDKRGRTSVSGTMTSAPTSTTTGWAAACSCGSTVAPCVVLDPFAGAGTTGVVATKMGRRFSGVELNPAYAEMANRRIEREFGSLLAWAEGGTR